MNQYMLYCCLIVSVGFVRAEEDCTQLAKRQRIGPTVHERLSHLGLSLKEGKDPVGVRQELEKIVEEDLSPVDLSRAQLALADMFRLGEGGSLDLPKAVHLYGEIIYRLKPTPHRKPFMLNAARFYLSEILCVTSPYNPFTMRRIRGLLEDIITSENNELPLRKLNHARVELTGMLWGERGGPRDVDRAFTLCGLALQSEPQEICPMDRCSARYYMVEIVSYIKKDLRSEAARIRAGAEDFDRQIEDLTGQLDSFSQVLLSGSNS